MKLDNDKREKIILLLAIMEAECKIISDDFANRLEEDLYIVNQAIASIFSKQAAMCTILIELIN